MSQHSIQCGIPSHSVFVTLTPLGPAFVAANPTVQCGAGVIRCLRPLGPAFVAANPTVQCGAGVRRLGLDDSDSASFPRPAISRKTANWPLSTFGKAGGMWLSRTAGQANKVQRLKATIIHVTLLCVDPSSMSASAGPPSSPVQSPAAPCRQPHSPAGSQLRRP